jgi:outer membrane protein OmpA-like peptidoglycan-associated protein
MKTLLATIVLAAIAAPAAAGPDFVTPSPRPKPLAASSGVREIAPFDDVLFELDSAVLSPVARQQLGSAAAWLKRHPGQRLVLEGYTDGSGPRFYNEDLATSRAVRARDHLISLGVPANRLIMVVYGELAARAQLDPLSRRVVLYATDRSPHEIAVASLDRKHALSAVWVDRGTLFSERREIVGSR